MKKHKDIVLIVIGVFLIFAFLLLNPTLEKKKEWNKISEDYDIIAEVSFDYYKKYVNKRNNYNGYIFLNISEDGKSLTQTISTPDKEDIIYQVDLTEKQKIALKNISMFYTAPHQRQESIMITSTEYLEITDDDAVGAFAIIKSKEKPTGWGNHKIYNLGNDWWQVVSTAR